MEVTWIDSAFNRGWGDTAEKLASLETVECRTVGYMLERKKSLKLAQSMASSDSFGDGIAIPASAVKRVRFLK